MTKYLALGEVATDPPAIDDLGLLYVLSTNNELRFRRANNAVSNPGGIINLGNPLSNPMTTDQDIIVGGSGGTPGRLGVGTAGQVLNVSGGGNVQWSSIASFNPARTIFVAQSGGDETTLAAALTAAGLLTPTVANPVLILMFPGTYSENDFIVPTGVNVVGHCRGSVIIDAADPAGTLCTVKNGASICGVTLQGASSGGGVGIQFDSASPTGGEATGITVDDCETLVRLFGGTVARMYDSTLTNSGINDVELTTVGDTLIVDNVEGNKDKVSAVSGAELLGSAHNNRDGERSFNVLSELHVGTFLHPRESAFGEGDSHILGMDVLRNTNLEAGTWSSIKDAMKSGMGSIAALFTASAVNNTLYFGGLLPFPGVKIDITTAITLGSGTLVWEYWEGSSWVDLPIMVTKADADYDHYADNAFGNVQNDQIRFGNTTGWAQKTLNGINKYWVRCRIATAAISVIPQAESSKLHTNRCEINSTGFQEFFGSARPTEDVPTVHLALTADLAGFSPANENIDMSTTVNLTPVDNEMDNGAVDGFGSTFQLGERVDTSFPISFEVWWKPLSNVSGDVALSLHTAQATIGDLINGTLPETVTTVLTAIAAQDDELQKTIITLDARTFSPGDLIGWALVRDATGATSPTNDDFPGDIAVMAIRASVRVWR